MRCNASSSSGRRCGAEIVGNLDDALGHVVLYDLQADRGNDLPGDTVTQRLVKEWTIVKRRQGGRCCCHASAS